LSHRGRPVNCRLYFPAVNDKLDDWLKEEITEGNADNYLWDRIDSVEGTEFKRTFGSLIEDFIDDGTFDDAVEDRAATLGYETP